VGLAEFLTWAIPIISSSIELLFDRFSKIPNLTKSVDVIPISYNDNTGTSSISTKCESRPSSSINDESGENLVDTTLSILKMLLLGFIFFYLLEREKSHIVQLSEIHSIYEFFIFYFLNFIFNFKCTLHIHVFFFIIKLIKLWKCILFPV